MFREYRRLDKKIFKSVYEANKDKTLTNRNIYVFGDQADVVQAGILMGKTYTIRKFSRINDDMQTDNLVYVVILDGIGMKRLDIKSGFSWQHLCRGQQR